MCDFSPILILFGSKSFILIILSKKLVCVVLNVYVFNTDFQFVLPGQTCFNFISANGNKYFCFA